MTIPAPNPRDPVAASRPCNATRTHPAGADGDPSEAAADSVAEGDGDSADADADDGERRGGGDRVESGVVTNVTRRRGDAIVARCRTRVVPRRQAGPGVEGAMCPRDRPPPREACAPLCRRAAKPSRRRARASSPRGPPGARFPALAPRGAWRMMMRRRTARPSSNPPRWRRPCNRRTVCCAEDPGCSRARRARAGVSARSGRRARGGGATGRDGELPHRPRGGSTARRHHRPARGAPRSRLRLRRRSTRSIARGRTRRATRPTVRRSARSRVRRGARRGTDIVQRVEERFHFFDTGRRSIDRTIRTDRDIDSKGIGDSNRRVSLSTDVFVGTRHLYSRADVVSFLRRLHSRRLPVQPPRLLSHLVPRPYFPRLSPPRGQRLDQPLARARARPVPASAARRFQPPPNRRLRPRVRLAPRDGLSRELAHQRVFEPPREEIVHALFEPRGVRDVRQAVPLDRLLDGERGDAGRRNGSVPGGRFVPTNIPGRGTARRTGAPGSSSRSWVRPTRPSRRATRRRSSTVPRTRARRRPPRVAPATHLAAALAATMDVPPSRPR